ncbi:MAG TPA: hypothetical protein VJ302_23340 [Blastocatellia bacterium]|nr:hypothetical protein [Blastocatellia bacterium]
MAKEVNKPIRKAVKLVNVPKPTHRLFRRALTLSGAGPQSRWLLAKMRQFIRETQREYGEDLFTVLTAEEDDLLRIISSGAAELLHIVEESMLPEKRVESMIADLIDRGFIDVRKRGGTEKARGASVKLYFVTEKYTGPVE